MRIKQLAQVLAVGLCVWCGQAASGQATTFADGQKIEVREGDSWSAATIVKKEGRKFLIHYEGADAPADEWVTADRLRAAGSGGATAAQPAPAPAPAATPPAAPTWATGQKVEVKWGGMWRNASIIRQSKGWYLVQYPPSPFREWVEPYRIRKMGSSVDNLGTCQPNHTVRGNEDPPDREPGEPPRPHGWTGDNAGETAADEAAYKEVNLSRARLLHLESPGKTWKLTPDAPDATRQVVSQSIALKGVNNEALDSVRVLAVARGRANWIYACHVSGMPSEGTRVRLERLDLENGASAMAWRMPSNTLLLDVSPDGQTALFRTDGFGAGKSGKVTLWSLEGPSPRETLAFTAFGGDWTTADIKGGIFADATHILLWNGKGRLVLWDIATARPLYSCQMNPGCTPAASANARYIAMNAGQRAWILESLTGKVAAEMPLDLDNGAAFAFSPSGARLAAYADHTVHVWDLSQGQLVSEFSTPSDLGGKLANISNFQNPGPKFDLVAEGFAMLDEAWLLDFEHRVVLWNYRPVLEGIHNARTVVPGGQYAYVCREGFRGGATLSMTRLPHPEALSAAEAIKPDEVLLLRPGMKVSLNVTISCAAEQRQQITDTLKRRIKEAGLELADNQPIVIHALVEPGKSEEREYRRIGVPGGRIQRATVTPQIAKLCVESAGKRVWEMQKTSSAGSMLMLKSGQSVQDAVNEASRPDIGFFEKARVPACLPQPRDPAWFGASILTEQGIRPAPPPRRPLQPERQPTRRGPNRDTA